MEAILENNILLTEEEPIDTASIPAQVFLNHFEAVAFHIRNGKDIANLRNMNSLKKFHPRLDIRRLQQVKAMLLNAWNTEFAMRNTAEMGDEQYLAHSLHWTFPQAYYSVLYSFRALLATQGTYSPNEEMISKRINNLVVRGFYPNPIGFYAIGGYGNFKIYRLTKTSFRPGLNPIRTQQEADSHIAQFLKTTRTIKAKALRQAIQADEKKALRNRRTGQVLEKFSKADWAAVTGNMSSTTFFDLLNRLRISSNNREIERYVQAAISFKTFHRALLTIVSYVNFVHETYLVKAVGQAIYEQWLSHLPDYLRNNFVERRYQKHIIPIFS